MTFKRIAMAVRRISLTALAVGLCPTLLAGCIPSESDLQTFAIDFLRQAFAAWLL